jgi:hypothetical protein
MFTNPLLSLRLYSPCGPWPLFHFLNLYTVGRTPWTGDQPVAHRRTQEQNNCTQTSMPRVGFEPTIPVFELAKTVHSLGRVAIVIGRFLSSVTISVVTTQLHLHTTTRRSEQKGEVALVMLIFKGLFSLAGQKGLQFPTELIL